MEKFGLLVINTPETNNLLIHIINKNNRSYPQAINTVISRLHEFVIGSYSTYAQLSLLPVDNFIHKGNGWINSFQQPVDNFVENFLVIFTQVMINKQIIRKYRITWSFLKILNLTFSSNNEQITYVWC